MIYDAFMCYRKSPTSHFRSRNYEYVTFKYFVVENMKPRFTGAYFKIQLHAIVLKKNLYQIITDRNDKHINKLAVFR